MESQTKTVITPETEKRPIYFDTLNLPWQTCTDKHLNADFLDMKLISDGETGLTINLSVYPKGYYKTKHIHDNCHSRHRFSHPTKIGFRWTLHSPNLKSIRPCKKRVFFLFSSKVFSFPLFPFSPSLSSEK